MVLSLGSLISVVAMRAQEAPQKAESKEYTRSEAMVPMRDGVQLHVVILRPVGSESGGAAAVFDGADAVWRGRNSSKSREG